MKEEESLLRRAIAAIAIALSLEWSVCARERVFGVYGTLFYLERGGVGVGVGGLVGEVDL